MSPRTYPGLVLSEHLPLVTFPSSDHHWGYTRPRVCDLEQDTLHLCEVHMQKDDWGYLIWRGAEKIRNSILGGSHSNSWLYFPFPFLYVLSWWIQLTFPKPFTSNRPARIPEVERDSLPPGLSELTRRSNGFLHSFYCERCKYEWEGKRWGLELEWAIDTSGLKALFWHIHLPRRVSWWFSGSAVIHESHREGSFSFI